MFFQINPHTPSSPLFVPRYRGHDWKFPNPKAFPNNYDRVVRDKTKTKHLFSEDALIWRVYVDEAAQFDHDITERFRGEMDSLMLFAALFSAIVSTILVRFHDSTFEPDYASAIIAILAQTMNDRRSSSDQEPISLHPTWGLELASSKFKPRIPFSVAMMWWLSLLFCLGMALLAVVVKQWLDYYTTTLSHRPLRAALTRHHRILGIIGWRVPLIVGVLPYVLSLGMLFFSLGVILLARTFSYPLVAIFSLVSCMIIAAYLTFLLVPLKHFDFPTVTPLTMIAYWFPYYLRRKDNPDEYKKSTISFNYHQHLLNYEVKFRHGELEAAKKDKLRHAAKALGWLYDITKDPSARLRILQSLAVAKHELHTVPLADWRSTLHQTVMEAFKVDRDEHSSLLCEVRNRFSSALTEKPTMQVFASGIAQRV